MNKRVDNKSIQKKEWDNIFFRRLRCKTVLINKTFIFK